MIRTALVAGIALVALSLGVVAQTTAPKPLPLDNLGLEHLDIIVPDPAASARFYARIFRSALHQQPVRPRDANGRVWSYLERDTRLGLEEASPGQAPTIAHYAIKVAPFDRSALETRLRELGTRMLPAADEPDVVRFADNNGIIVEVRVAQ